MTRYEIDYSLWPEHARPPRRWTSFRSVMGAFATGGVLTIAGLAVLSHMTISPAARAETEAARVAAERSRIQIADTGRAVPLTIAPVALAKPVDQPAQKMAQAPANTAATDGRGTTQQSRTEKVAAAPVAVEPVSVDRKVVAVAQPQTTEIFAAEVKPVEVKTVEKPKAVKRMAKKTDPFNPSAANAFASADGRAASPAQRQDQMWRRMTEERSRSSANPFAVFSTQRF